MKCYSYIRFSTPDQIKGHSLQRQLQAAQDYCNKNSLELSDQSFQDLGISGFKGNNATQGKLRAFIDAVDDGKILPGSTLLVESLDRISRNEILAALNLFTSILQRDIKIVTLSDNKLYTRENINDISNLLFSLIIMSRAHEESATKSVRIKASWDNKKLLAKQGVPIGKHAPAWIDLIDKQYVIKPQAKEIIEFIFDQYKNNVGYYLISKELNSKFPVFTQNRKTESWNATKVKGILTSEAVTGRFQNIIDYYPRIISDEDFCVVQELKLQKQSGSAGRPSTVINLFANLLFCGKCKKPMVRLNKGINVYYQCTGYRNNTSTCSKDMIPNGIFEPLILKTLSELDVNSIFDVNDDVKKLSGELAILKTERRKLSESQNNLMKALEIGSGIESIVTRLQELQDLVKEIDHKIKDLEQSISQKEILNSSATRIIKDILNSGDRRRVNLEIKKLITKILLWQKSFTLFYKSGKFKRYYLNSGKSIVFPDYIQEEI